MVRAQILSKSTVSFIQAFLKNNALQPNFDSIKVIPLTVTSMPKKNLAKSIAVWLRYNSKYLPSKTAHKLRATP
jgi:hypothetical protein